MTLCRQSTDANTDKRINRKFRHDNSDATNDKTDGESSYSSFYSSFFKTDSGSNEENDTSNPNNKGNSKYSFRQKKSRTSNSASMKSVEAATSLRPNEQKITRRKMEPPWMEQVCLTSELIYKYQILAKDINEVLSSDMEKLKHLEQPALVNEQLGQLYLDLQLEGVAARLTLEEGITSSSSSSEESTVQRSKSRRRKRQYSKFVMIYEEDAPLPPPDDDSSFSS